MPELPEVETTCRGLANALVGKRVTEIIVHRADLRIPFPKNMAAQLTGHKIVKIYRRAKYILMEFDHGLILLLHLGMSGRMVLSEDLAEPIGKHDHLVMHFKGPGIKTLKFNDPRRFGLCDLIPKAKLDQHKLLHHLGVEPLEDGLTSAYLQKAFKGKKTSIKLALLDQTIIAGLGNIYVCEALFYTGIAPTRSAASCTSAEIKKLIPAIRKVLRAAIKAGGSSLRDYVHTDGQLGYFQNKFAVYDREGSRCLACTCDSAKTGGVSRMVQGGRSTYYCATKQS